MELTKQKYKQTEVGLIPDDWKVFILGNVLNGIADVDHYMPKTEKYGVPYVMTGDLKEQVGDIDFDNCKKISDTAYKKLSKKVKNEKGDIILARYATIGNVSFVNIDYDFIVSYSCVTIKPDSSKLIGLFLYYYFKSNIFKLEVKNKVNANIQDNVGIGDLVKLKIPLPPTLKEQTTIANALSDTDSWINSLEQLLTKKRQIKQGAMQELLQPKDGWELKSIKQIVATPVTDGPHETPQFIKNGIPFLSVNNIINNEISWQDLRYISKIDDERFSLKCKPIKNDILLGKAASVGKVAIVKTEKDFNIWSPLALIRTKKEYDSNFLFYLLQTESTNIQISYFTNSSSQGNIGMGDIEKISFSFPKHKEQTRIATILSDMDDEIAQLETKLAKAKQIKQGMMQELLTGRIRLV